jgi:hypothetical protein
MTSLWRVKNSLALMLVASAALFGCGGDDDSNSNTNTSSGGQAAQNGGGAACIDAWNAGSEHERAQGSLSHRGDEPKDIYIGTYKGQAFTETGNGYDDAGSTETAEISVAPGDCVAVDRTGTNDAETNWVMVAPKANGGGKSWYFLDETGSHPLAKSPQPLDGETMANIAGFGVDAKLSP